jgi:plastocyanin
VAAVLGLATVVAAPAADAAVQPVNIAFAAFSPTPLDVLPGETVLWSNVSVRRHTVTSDAGVFASGDLFAGNRFAWTFATVGAYPYHCTVHPGMVGEVDVRRVTLGPLPPAAVPAGTRVELTGRTADPSRPVRIERSGDGTAFTAVASAGADAAGNWSAAVRAERSGSYRAASGADVSETRPLLVTSRRIKLRRTRRGIRVTVTPSDPYAKVMLQRRERERFGWWPIARARLDYTSRAGFPVRSRGRYRAILLDRDGWSALATSRVLVISRRAPRPGRHPAGPA